MSSTRAVPLDLLTERNPSGGSGQPLCPACDGGRLHPYQVTISLGGFQGTDWLYGPLRVTSLGMDEAPGNWAVLNVETMTWEPGRG